jgi:hypothetical protein
LFLCTHRLNERISQQGDVNSYPFDTYTGTLILIASIQSNSSSTLSARDDGDGGDSDGGGDGGDGDDKVTCSTPIPVLPSIKGTAQGFAVSAIVTPGTNVDGSVDYSTVNVNFGVRRARFHVVFSLFIFTSVSLPYCFFLY